MAGRTKRFLVLAALVFGCVDTFGIPIATATGNGTFTWSIRAKNGLGVRGVVRFTGTADSSTSVTVELQGATNALRLPLEVREGISKRYSDTSGYA